MWLSITVSRLLGPGRTSAKLGASADQGADTQPSRLRPAVPDRVRWKAAVRERSGPRHAQGRENAAPANGTVVGGPRGSGTGQRGGRIRPGIDRQCPAERRMGWGRRRGSGPPRDRPSRGSTVRAGEGKQWPRRMRRRERQPRVARSADSAGSRTPGHGCARSQGGGMPPRSGRRARRCPTRGDAPRRAPSHRSCTQCILSSTQSHNRSSSTRRRPGRRILAAASSRLPGHRRGPLPAPQWQLPVTGVSRPSSHAATASGLGRYPAQPGGQVGLGGR